jgi:Ca-activated chloride channel family protein
VVLTTMTQAKSGVVVLSGRRGVTPWEAKLDLSSAIEGVGVSKIWARSKITAVEATRYTGAKEGDIDVQVLHVALDHHLVSRLTSLVAVDVTPSRPVGEALDSQAMPTNLPHGWNFEKVFGEDPSNPSIRAAVDSSAFLKLAMKDKVSTASGEQGVELPQTDAGTDLALFVGFLLFLSGMLMLVMVVRAPKVRT